MHRIVLGLALAFAPTAHAEEVTIHADATLQKRASTRSTALLSIEAGETADLLAQKNGWIKVRVRGQTGWIPQETMVELEVDDAPTEVAVVEAEEPAQLEEQVDVPDPPVVERERRVDIAIAAGLTVITQGFRTRGATTTSDNYNLGVTAATLAVAGSYTHRLRDDLVVGAELAYSFQKALPGIRHTDPDGEAITTAFSVHDVGLRLVAGYDLQRPSGLVLLARAGVRYHLFQVAGVDDPVTNPSMIPSEIQLSPTLGAGIQIANVTPALGLRFVVDAFVAGTRVKQTPGQEDGVSARARGATVQSALTYRWRPGLDVRVTHDFGIAVLDFGAPDPMSARAHEGTAVSRLDVVHMLTVGIAKGF